MSDEDETPPLSKEDQALWDKVKQTIAPPQRAGHPRAQNSDGDKASHRSHSLTPTTEDFAALLEGTAPKARPKKSESAVKKSPENAAAPPRPSGAQRHSARPKKQVSSLAKREVRNISSGKDIIEAAIDLHGLTAREAETALKIFLKKAQADGKRLALVITGKGQRRRAEDRAFELGAPEPGVLKREVPTWLTALPDLVQSHAPAHKKHGGDGALYVRLRRKNKGK